MLGKRCESERTEPSFVMRRIGITACRLCVQLCVLAAGMATLVSLRARMGDALRRSALERASLKVMGTPAWDAISILQVPGDATHHIARVLTRNRDDAPGLLAHTHRHTYTHSPDNSLSHMG